MSDHSTKTVEVWKDIPGHEGHYQVSNLGRVKSLKRWVYTAGKRPLLLPERILRTERKKKTGYGRYLVVTLCKNGKPWSGTVHKLVALAFVPNPQNLSEVNHIDTDKRNNRASNLEWVTKIGNTEHAKSNGLYKGIQGSKRSDAKLTEVVVLQIRSRLNKGEEGRTISKELGVSEGLVSMIKHRKIWRHV